MHQGYDIGYVDLQRVPDSYLGCYKGESYPQARTSLSAMTHGCTRQHFCLDKLERGSWSYTSRVLCANIVPLVALMVGKVRPGLWETQTLNSMQL